MAEDRDSEPGVSWRSVRTVIPRWGSLLGPVALVIVPLALVVSVAYVIVLGESERGRQRGAAVGRNLLVTCETLTCDSAAARPLARRNESTTDVEVAIGPDGRPAILYRGFDDDIDYHTRFVRCSTPTCDRVTEVDIPGFRGAPVLALDSTGRPLITGTRHEYGNPFDAPEYGLLLSCRDHACGRRDTVNLGAMGRGFGAKDMVVGPDDLPRILWAGARSSDDDTRMRVTTSRRPRCGAR